EAAALRANAAAQLFEMNRFAEAEQLSRQTVSLYSGLVAELPDRREPLASEYVRLGEILSTLRRPEQAADAFKAAAARYGELSVCGPRSDDFLFAAASCHNNLALELVALRRSALAVENYTKALDLYDRLPEKFRSRAGYRLNVGLTRNNLATLL